MSERPRELALRFPERQGWESLAACRGMGLADFFSPPGSEGERRALEVCGVCPVTGECLEFARRGQVKFGTWGGTPQRRLPGQRRRRRTEPSAPTERCGCGQLAWRRTDLITWRCRGCGSEREV